MNLGLVLCWPPIDMFKDFKYSICLFFKAKHKLLNKQDFDKIKELEKLAYPDDQLAYENINNIRGLKKIYTCFNKRQIDYYLDDNSYCIVVLHYNLVYLADVVSLKDPFKIISVLHDFSKKYKDKDIYMYARERTGYKLLKAHEKKGAIRILEDIVDENDDNEGKDEIYHMLKIKTLPD